MSTKLVNTTCHLIAQKAPECTKLSIHRQKIFGSDTPGPPDLCWDPAVMPTPPAVFLQLAHWVCFMTLGYHWRLMMTSTSVQV